MVLLGPKSKVDFQPLYVRNQSRGIVKSVNGMSSKALKERL